MCVGLTNKSSEDLKPEPEIPGLKPANPAVLPAPQKADANLGDYQALSPQVLQREGFLLNLLAFVRTANSANLSTAVRKKEAMASYNN